MRWDEVLVPCLTELGVESVAPMVTNVDNTITD